MSGEINDADILAAIKRSIDALDRHTALITKVWANNQLIMDKCRGTDCGYTMANKACEQHSRCAQCPQRWIVKA